MIIGHVRNGFPLVTLALPGRRGTMYVEFILDTGFEGELSVPGHVMRELDSELRASHLFLMADGSDRRAKQYRLSMDWNEEERRTEIIELEGRPLLGNLLLEGCSVHMDMVDGGEVTIEF